MTFAVRLREEADLDLAEAASWYESQQIGLGHRFRIIGSEVLVVSVMHGSLWTCEGFEAQF